MVGIRLIEQSVTTVGAKRGERTYLHSAQKGRRGKHSGEMEAHLTAVMASNPAAGEDKGSGGEYQNLILHGSGGCRTTS